MRNAVLKFHLPSKSGEHMIVMPIGARVLCVHEQNGDVQLWAAVDYHSNQEVRRFRVVYTGMLREEPLPEKYIGSAFLDAGRFVIHVFELPL